jgi:3-hydroxypropanoate dehydrogenase
MELSETGIVIMILSADAQNLLFRDARTANSFSDEPLPPGTVEAIYDLVKWAPSSGNTQPLRYLVIESAQARARLIPHLAEPNRKKTLSAPLAVILAADTAFFEHMNDLLPYMANARDYFGADAAKAAEGARYNAILQAGYFILGVRAAGFAAGPMLGFDAAGVDAEFFPHGRHKSILVVNVGKPGPDAWMQRLPRLEADQVITTI